MNRFCLAGMLAAGVALTVACGPSSDDIVAVAGEARISLGAAQEFTDGLDSALHSKKSGMEARRDYVESLVIEELLVMEARARGVHDDPKFQEDIERRFRKRSTNAYVRDRLTPALIISEQDIRDRYARLEYDKGKELSRLLVSTLEEAQRLRAELEQGARFDSLARIHSLDPQSGPRGGYVGVLNWADAADVNVPRHVFVALEPGGVSEPLEASDGYMLVHCNALQETDIARYVDQIGRKMKRDRFLQANAALIDSLVEVMQLTLETEGLNTLTRMNPETTPGAAEARQSVYSYTGGDITVGDYVKAVERAEGDRPYGDSTQVVRTAENFIIPRVLIWVEAQKVGYADNDEILRWKRRKTRDLLIRAVRKHVSDQVTVTDEEVSDYYQRRGEELRSAEQMHVEEILLDTESEAEQVRMRVEAGESFADLSILTRRHGEVESHGELHLHPYESPVYGEAMMDAVAGASIGEIVGPLQVKGGYSVFRLVDRGGGVMPTLEESVVRIRGMMTVVKREALFNDFLDEMMRKYASQIQINNEVLARLRLPGER